MRDMFAITEAPGLTDRGLVLAAREMVRTLITARSENDGVYYDQVSFDQTICLAAAQLVLMSVGPVNAFRLAGPVGHGDGLWDAWSDWFDVSDFDDEQHIATSFCLFADLIGNP